MGAYLGDFGSEGGDDGHAELAVLALGGPQRHRHALLLALTTQRRHKLVVHTVLGLSCAGYQIRGHHRHYR
jgi:hypothetical protein